MPLLSKGGETIKTILVVDDNEGIRRLLKEFLTQEKYRVETATNGREALQQITKKLPSLVLLDYKMPKKNGLQVLDELSKQFPDLPVIMITGYYEENEIKKARSKGVEYYIIIKPFSLFELLETIESII